MEFFKEIYDAWGARVKSRVFGSIIVAFTLINWKVLFFLAFEDAKATEKFSYFDAHTSAFTLYVWPIFLGGFIGLVLPYVNNWTHWYVSKPVSAMRSRDDEYAHERLKKKNAWLAERNRAQELLERQIIDEAKRDEEVAEIADPVRRAEVEEEISRTRGSSTEQGADDAIGEFDALVLSAFQQPIEFDPSFPQWMRHFDGLVVRRLTLLSGSGMTLHELEKALPARIDASVDRLLAQRFLQLQEETVLSVLQLTKLGRSKLRQFAKMYDLP